MVSTQIFPVTGVVTLNPLAGGLALVPNGLVQLLLAPVSARLTTRLGGVTLAIGSLVILARFLLRILCSPSLRLDDSRGIWEWAMVQQVKIPLQDDLDGSTADEIVRFGVVAGYFEIDLVAARASEVRGALEKFVRGGEG